MSGDSILSGCKLTYFPLPGRGESIRLAFKIGNIPFEDEIIPFKDWKELKPKTPWGGLPYITLTDGTVIAQQRAILRYVGKETGLYPKDSLLACKCDEVMDAVDELQVAIKAAGKDLDAEGRRQARCDAASSEKGGFLATGLQKINDFIAANGNSGHVVGSELTIADIVIFISTSMICSGFYDGVPQETIKEYPHIQTCRKLVANIPEVKAHYDNKEELSSVETFFKGARDL